MFIPLRQLSAAEPFGYCVVSSCRYPSTFRNGTRSPGLRPKVLRNPRTTRVAGVPNFCVVNLLYVDWSCGRFGVPVEDQRPWWRSTWITQTAAMPDATKRITRIAGVIAVLYAARRYYRNWGTTKEECRVRLPGDELVGEPVLQATEAVWIDAPPSAIWPWLLQMGQDRGGLYSYQALENVVGLRFHNANRVHPEWQQLAVGDVVRLAPEGWLGLREGLTLRVEAIAPERSIVFRSVPPNLPKAVWSFHLQPHWDHHSRLLARTRVGLRHPGEVFAMELARPAIALMTRGVLLGIKRRVQPRTNDLATWDLCP